MRRTSLPGFLSLSLPLPPLSLSNEPQIYLSLPRFWLAACRTVKYKLARLRREPSSTVVDQEEHEQKSEGHERWGGLAWMVELFHESDWKPVFKRAFSECFASSGFFHETS